MTSQYVVDKLIKAKRKFNIVDNFREAEIFCVKCEKSLGIHDLIYDSHESLKLCSKCAKKYIQTVPNKISDTLVILEDNGLSVVLRYEQSRQEEYKQCYFTSKGRFINIKGKRVYI